MKFKTKLFSLHQSNSPKCVILQVPYQINYNQQCKLIGSKVTYLNFLKTNHMVKLKPKNLATTLPYDLKTVRFETDVKDDL